jgi:hypothetical protein
MLCFVLPAQEVLQYILSNRYATDLNFGATLFLRRDKAGEAVIRIADGFASVSPRRQIPSADSRGKLTQLLRVGKRRGKIFNIWLVKIRGSLNL